jgi:hypothetical protein
MNERWLWLRKASMYGEFDGWMSVRASWVGPIDDPYNGRTQVWVVGFRKGFSVQEDVETLRALLDNETATHCVRRRDDYTGAFGWVLAEGRPMEGAA